MSVIDDINNQQENNIVVDYAKKLSQQPETTELPAYEPGKFLKEYLKANEGFKPVTVEEQEAEKKRQKRNMLLGSIGDAFSAFHTAYANARGVKPMVNPGESLTGKMRERYERLNKEREARDLTYNAGLQQAMQRDEQNALNWQTLKEKAEERKAAAEEKRQEREEKASKIINNRDGSKDLWNPLNGTLVRIKDPDPVLVENIKSQTNRNNRSNSGTTTRKNQDWTTTVRDKYGKVKSTTTRSYGSGGKDNLKRDENGNIIINY